MNTYLIAKNFLRMYGVNIYKESKQFLWLENEHGVCERISNTEDSIMDYLGA